MSALTLQSLQTWNCFKNPVEALALSDDCDVAVASTNKRQELHVSVMKTDRAREQILIPSQNATKVRLEFMQRTLCVSTNRSFGVVAEGELSHLEENLEGLDERDSNPVHFSAHSPSQKVATVTSLGLKIWDIEKQVALHNFAFRLQYLQNRVFFYGQNELLVLKSDPKKECAQITLYDARKSPSSVKAVDVASNYLSGRYSSSLTAALLGANTSYPLLVTRTGQRDVSYFFYINDLTRVPKVQNILLENERLTEGHTIELISNNKDQLAYSVQSKITSFYPDAKATLSCYENFVAYCQVWTWKPNKSARTKITATSPETIETGICPRVSVVALNQTHMLFNNDQKIKSVPLPLSSAPKSIDIDFVKPNPKLVNETSL